MMDHIDDIKKLVQILMGSSKIHLLIIQGPSGWSKTQTVTTALHDAGVRYKSIGSYTTPLALFNQLAEAPDDLILLDDTTGVFNNQQMLSILCAATWSNGEVDDCRRVRRTSTSEKALADFVDFSGKMIVITNYLPKSPLVEALVNRSLIYRANIEAESIGQRLLDAAKSERHFSEIKVASDVAKYLNDNLSNLDSNKISLRTLELGYELAMNDSDGWQVMFSKLLPWKNREISRVDQVMASILKAGGTVEEQVLRFCRETGKSRRTFFYLRKNLMRGTI